MSFPDERRTARKKRRIKKYWRYWIWYLSLSNKIFERMNAKAIDPTLANTRCFKCPPNGKQKDLGVATSGMSKSMGPKFQVLFGLGIEFLMETEDEETWL